MRMISENLAPAEHAAAPGPRSGSGLMLLALSFLPLMLVGAWVLWVAQSPSAQMLDASFLFLCH